MIDITAVITGHGEGLLAGPALRSFEAAVAHARAAGKTVEVLAVLDRPDAITSAMFAAQPADRLRIVTHNGGDPALTRGRGVQEAVGTHVAFLDADDLWSENWLTAAHDFVCRSPRPVVAHSEMNVVFGSMRAIWWHADSEAEDFDIDFQRIGNYWDAMCLARREIFLAHPFRQNDIKAGYGHEDWHWNNMTLAAGIAHRPVPGTVHFKRRRDGSQMEMCDRGDVVVYPTAITAYSPL
jgi:hypothetical protein